VRIRIVFLGLYSCERFDGLAGLYVYRKRGVMCLVKCSEFANIVLRHKNACAV
jgi:hypothetical protein